MTNHLQTFHHDLQYAASQFSLDFNDVRDN